MKKPAGNSIFVSCLFLKMKFNCFLSLFFICFLAGFSVSAQIPDDQIQIPGRGNDLNQQQKPYLILISADGFRDDYFDIFQPEFLNEIRAEAVRASYMIPSYPSVTFPNHYTIVTGLIPPHHGLVGNNMFNPETGARYSLRNQKEIRNPEWYGGIPIWSLAEKQNMLTACYYWPGSEAPIAGFYPSYYYPYSETKPVEERIRTVVEWLNLPDEKRPHLITFYMPEVDQAGHRHGPKSEEVKKAVRYADQAVQKLTEAVSGTGLDVNYIFLSDHGMQAISTKNPIRLPEIDPDLMDVVVNGTYVSIFPKKDQDLDTIYSYFKNHATLQYEVYLKSSMPAKFRFSDKEDRYNRIGDVVLIAKSPYYFSGRTPAPGSHGYLAQETPTMNTVFMAWGPDIKRGKTIEPFQNIHIYPLLAEILGLEYDHPIDGDRRLIPQVMRDR